MSRLSAWIRSRLSAVAGCRLGIGWLFALALSPGLLVGTVLFYDLYCHERAQLEQGALQTARALSLAVDRELAGMRGKLELLATSPLLRDGDLKTFYRQSQDILASEELAGAIVLIDGSGQQVLNTLRPLGSELPQTGHPELVRQTFATGKPAISDLYIGGVAKRPFVALEVPVMIGGKVAYALDMGIPAERLNQLLVTQGLPPGWVVALLDSQGTIVARSQNPERTVGKKATPDLLAAMAKGREGSMASRTLEGLASFLAYSGTDSSGWTVVVAMTQDVVYSSLYRPLILAALAVTAFLVGGGLLAMRLTRHLRESLQALGTAAEAAGAGCLESMAPMSGPREVAHVAEQFNRMQAARREADQEQKRLHRTLLLLSETNVALLYADQEEQLLPEVCRLVVEKGNYLLAWVGFAETNAEKSVRQAAAAGFRTDYLESLRISWGDDEFGRGPTGTAIRTGTTQINQNVQTNPKFQPWREDAAKRGIQSSIALPLINDGVVIGALMIYGEEPDAFGPDEVNLLEKLAGNLSFGIERLRTRMQLAIANKELQGFTYAASHDMKAPLTRIISFSSLLERNYRSRLEGDGLMFLDFVRQNATRLMALVDDLLSHAQIEQQALHLESIRMDHAVQALLQEKADDVAEAGAELHLNLPVASVRANPMALAQVLRNLLENALKYSSQAQPPIIEIGGRVSSGFCCLWVRDNGIGFDMAYHDRIFEIFRRLHTYAEFPGSGVGLALVKKAMERMGGRVWAEGAVGEGASFFIELPLSKEVPSDDSLADSRIAANRQAKEPVPVP